MEYNTKTRIGIWMCLLMMLIVLCFVLAGVFHTETGKVDRPANAEKPDEDAILVGAKPQSPEETGDGLLAETTETTEPAAETEKKALYYVTVSGNEVVVLDEYGELHSVLRGDTAFLPKEDLDALRAGITLYSKEELSEITDDLAS